MLSVEDRIKKNTMAIMRHKKWCAYSGVMACGKVTMGECATAKTDGWNTWYNPTFVRDHAPDEPRLRFLMLHEATHKAYRHLHVWQQLHEEDPTLANVAADHFVNLSLQDTDAGEGFIRMLDVGIAPDERFRGMSVMQIFRLLQQEQEDEGKPEDGKKEPGGDGEGQPTPGGEGEDEGQPTPGGEENGKDQEPEGMDDHDWEGAKKISQEAQEKRADEIERAIRQGEMMRKKLAGKGAGDTEGAFGDLLKPRVDWKQALRDFISELCAARDESSWRKVNRRYLADDVYLPGVVGETIGELVIGFDTSGSCFGNDVMTRFVTEITTIVEQVAPSKLHVIYWDWDIQGHQIFEDGQFAVQSLKPRGGGGTDGKVLFNYLREKKITPQAIVQFTDGYVGDFGKSDCPVLWAMTTDVVAPYGVTIKVEI